MAKLGLIVKLKAQPGKRDQVKQNWEKLIKPRIEEENNVEFYFYCYALEDEDTIYLFEFITDPVKFEAASQSDWFLNYMEQLKPMLVGPPERIMTTPIWAKGASV